MIGRWLLDFWRGYVVVTLRGERIPELLNRATAQGILFWEIKQVGENVYRLRMHREDVKELRSLLSKTRTRIHFERKLGMPFLAWRAWRRKFFVAGALTFLVGLYALTSFVWEVQVVGDLKEVQEERILQAASEIGIRRGILIGKLPDTDILQNRLLDKVPELVWNGIQIQGTKITIQVVERVPGVQEPSNQPQNIVATKQGVIKQIQAHRGVAAVKRETFVKPGQVLISGALIDGKTNVHAAGIVKAAVWYTSKLTVPLNTTRQAYTGEAVEKHFLTFFGHPVQIWGYGKIPYEKTEEIEQDKVLKIGDFVFPIQYRHTTYREVNEEKVTLTQEQAEKEALRLARIDLQGKIGEDGTFTTQKVLRSTIKDGNLEVEVFSEVLENIGKPQGYASAPTPEK
ncbi:sporulation protein YqfD [Tumebacillus algifaecis]|uniref:Sporulation protein YqfD n=1 Tax=Tumebacillus algifaecis TaxID=1214604 RepID=A0A223D362_9BACL|nr:sporulation protein YqfD [Tumebacillus algifaecis]ASS76088.1 sporulation protein YqfD [Tumebacillus algifaecis]